MAYLGKTFFLAGFGPLVANERINDGHTQRESEASQALACGTTVSRRMWHLPGAANHTSCMFSITTQLAKSFNEFAKLKIVSPAAMAKLTGDRQR